MDKLTIEEIENIFKLSEKGDYIFTVDEDGFHRHRTDILAEKSYDEICQALNRTEEQLINTALSSNGLRWANDLAAMNIIKYLKQRIEDVATELLMIIEAKEKAETTVSKIAKDPRFIKIKKLKTPSKGEVKNVGLQKFGMNEMSTIL